MPFDLTHGQFFKTLQVSLRRMGFVDCWVQILLCSLSELVNCVFQSSISLLFFLSVCSVIYGRNVLKSLTIIVDLSIFVLYISRPCHCLHKLQHFISLYCSTYHYAVISFILDQSFCLRPTLYDINIATLTFNFLLTFGIYFSSFCF